MEQETTLTYDVTVFLPHALPFLEILSTAELESPLWVITERCVDSGYRSGFEDGFKKGVEYTTRRWMGV